MGLAAFAACGIVIGLSAKAQAHFKLDAPACYMTQDSTGYPQKGAPCGPPDNQTVGTPMATMAVTAYKPGDMVTIKVTPTVPHSGWWRVALHTGKSSTQTTTTFPEAGGTGVCNPPKIMNPVWSPTQPVIADGLLDSKTALTGQQTMQVKLPDGITCTAAAPCSLQVMMIMTDHSQPSCYYHHCADITIGGGTDGGTGTDAGKPDAASGAGGSGNGGAGGATTGTAGAGGASSGSGGAATGGSTGAGGSTSAGGSGGDVTSGGGGSSTTGGSGGSSAATTTSTTSGAGGAATTTTTSGAGGTSGGSAGGDNGCSCAIPGRSAGPFAPLAAIAALAAATGARRRSRRRPRA
jgi:hypothetical protein